MKKLKTHIYNGEIPDNDGKINILISGFYQQDMVSVEQVVEALQPIPRRHLENLRVVKYDPHRKVQQAMSAINDDVVDNEVIGVYYDMKTPGIVIYRFSGLEEFYSLFYHELGHYVYYKIISQSLKVRWVNEIYANNRRFVSNYAALNASEDFAECYSFFCVYPHVLWQIPEKMRFIAEKVFYMESGSYDFSRIGLSGGVKPAFPDII